MANHKLISTYNLTLPKSSEELRIFYDEWADTYTEDYEKFGYKGPRDTAETLAEYLPDKNAKILDLGCGTGMVGEQDYKKFGYEGPRVTAETLAEYLPDKDAKILDLGSGTGMVGEQLLNSGFSNTHALDMSRKSLKICEERQLYKTYTCSKIGGNPTNIESESFDALVTCGTFIPNHLNQSCFPEMVRVVKSGGLIVLAMREEYLWKAPEYMNNQLENAVSKMTDDGKWKVLQRKRITKFYCDKDGLVFVFERT